MFDRTSLREGMEVRTRDGEKLGKIVRCGESEFEIEKGFFFPKEYIARYDDVADLRDGAAFLAISSDELKRMQDGSGGERWQGSTSAGSERLVRGGGATDEIRVPVTEEELDVQKREREAGRVTVTKEVETEEREIKVPVKKERVRVERGPADRRAADVGEGAFEQRTVSVPVHEEEVEIRKRPVVADEVRISKSAGEEEREISTDVRKENVDVRTEGDVGPTRGEPER
jgi:uncharacterized protein (TIGR02271 family)